MKMIKMAGYVGDEVKVTRFTKKYYAMKVAELDQILTRRGMFYMLHMSKADKVAALVGTMIAEGLSMSELEERALGRVKMIVIDVAV